MSVEEVEVSELVLGDVGDSSMVGMSISSWFGVRGLSVFIFQDSFVLSWLVL